MGLPQSQIKILKHDVKEESKKIVKGNVDVS